MVRADERTWMKTCIEYTDSAPHLSAVYTNTWSDWSVIRLDGYRGRLDLRVTRHAETLRVQFRDANGAWQLLRLGYLGLPATCRVGVMACSRSDPASGPASAICGSARPSDETCMADRTPGRRGVPVPGTRR